MASLVPKLGSSPHLPLKVKDFYSDYRFQSWLCASLEIKSEWLSTDNIQRRENLFLEDFIRDFEEPKKPGLLHGALASWPALKKWDGEYLLAMLILLQVRPGLAHPSTLNPTVLRHAWNVVERGSKKWVMYPPEMLPPGVYPSHDGADGATFVSITGWFMNFYAETKQRGQRPVECICRAGEVVFVPRGWWHVVINLEESIAITQNFVSRSNILNVLEFLSRPNSQHLVSGTEDRVNFYEKFRSTYEPLYPGAIEATERKNEKHEAALQKYFNMGQCC